jgi:hypothetical protein
LTASINKWTNVARGAFVAQGRSDCPLCEQYNNDTHLWQTCSQCPIRKDINQPYCRGTPYIQYDLKTRSCNDRDDLAVARAAKPEAKAELDYLKGLQHRCFVRVKGARVPATAFRMDGSFRSKQRS